MTFSNQAFGQYVPGDSFLHQADPRIKIGLLVVLIVALFVCQSPWALLILTGMVIFHQRIAGIRWKTGFRIIKPLLPILILAFVINLFAPQPDSRLIFQWKFLRISQESLLSALVMALRIGTLIFASNLFMTLTTSAMRLADAMESLLSPLKKVGVPVGDVAMMLSIALRFIPTLMEETDQIMKAQSSRGANFDTGGLFRRLKGYVSVLVPLFISAFHRAEMLANAMEARSYRSGMPRGKLNPMKIYPKDAVYGFSLTAFMVILMVVDSSGLLG